MTGPKFLCCANLSYMPWTSKMSGQDSEPSRAETSHVRNTIIIHKSLNKIHLPTGL